jgi:hypothetical protein
MKLFEAAYCITIAIAQKAEAYNYFKKEWG